MKSQRFSLIIILGICLSGTGFAQEKWSGTYEGNIDGVASVLTVRLSFATLTGTINASGYIYHMEGKVNGTNCSGKIVDRNTGGEMEYTASLKGNKISIILILTNAFGQSSQVPLEFIRSGEGNLANQPPSADQQGTLSDLERDQRIIGGWRHTSTYTSDDFSTVSEWYMQINADGTYRYGDGQVMGGDSNLSFDSGQGSASTGQWKTQGKVVYINEGNGWQSYANYIVDSNSMLFKFTDGSKQLWERYR